MLFLVRLTDRSNAGELRSQFLEAHKAWLMEHREQVRAAGLIRDDENGPSLGACWIVAGESRRVVEQLVRSDPFYLNGVRATCEILQWQRAFPPGPVTL
jgi:uncharacterized protein YciI